MASDQVTTIFGGDDSPFQAVARRVQQSIRNLTEFKAPGNLTQGVQSAFTSIEGSAKGAAGGIGLLKGALAELMPLITAVAGVASVFEAFRKSITQAAERELAGQQFEAIAGGANKAAAAIEKLEEVSHETGTDFPELARGAKRLMEAGLSANEAADATERLQKIALETGSDFQELADIYARVTTKQEVSAKDLTKLAAAGIPGIADIAKEFKNLETSTKNADMALEHSNELLKQQYELAEKNTSAINSFGQKTGLLQKVFENFKNANYSSTFFKIFSFDRVSKGIAELSDKFGKQFVDGLKQISQETGISELDLKTFLDEGKLGFEDLIAASARFREEQEKRRQTNVEAERYARQVALLEEQRSLLGQISEAINKATGEGGIFASVKDFLNTFTGKWREIAHDIDETFESFGKPLLDAFKPVLDQIHAMAPALQDVAQQFGAWMGDEVTEFFRALETGDWTILLGQLKGLMETAAQALTDAIGKADFSEINAKFKDAFEIGANTLISMFKSDVFTALDETLQKGVANAIDAFVKAAPGIGEALLKGIQSAMAEQFSGGAKNLREFLFKGTPLEKEGWMDVQPTAPPTPEGKTSSLDDLQGTMEKQTTLLETSNNLASSLLEKLSAVFQTA